MDHWPFRVLEWNDKMRSRRQNPKFWHFVWLCLIIFVSPLNKWSSVWWKAGDFAAVIGDSYPPSPSAFHRWPKIMPGNGAQFRALGKSLQEDFLSLRNLDLLFKGTWKKIRKSAQLMMVCIVFFFVTSNKPKEYLLVAAKSKSYAPSHPLLIDVAGPWWVSFEKLNSSSRQMQVDLFCIIHLLFFSDFRVINDIQCI